MWSHIAHGFFHQIIFLFFKNIIGECSSNFFYIFNDFLLIVWGNFLLWDRDIYHKDGHANFDHPAFKANSLIKLMKLLVANTMIFCNLPDHPFTQPSSSYPTIVCSPCLRFYILVPLGFWTSLNLFQNGSIGSTRFICLISLVS